MAGPGSQTHEFQVLAETGEDELVYSESYGAKYRTADEKVSGVEARELCGGLNLIETPEQSTCEDVARFLNINIEYTLKTLFLKQ